MKIFVALNILLFALLPILGKASEASCVNKRVKYLSQFHIKNIKNLNIKQRDMVANFMEALKGGEFTSFKNAKISFEEDLHDVTIYQSLVHQIGKLQKREPLAELLDFYKIQTSVKTAKEKANSLAKWIKTDLHRKFVARHLSENREGKNYLIEDYLLKEHDINVNFEQIDPYIIVRENFEGVIKNIKTSIIRRSLDHGMPIDAFSGSGTEVSLGARTVGTFTHWYMIVKDAPGAEKYIRFDGNVSPMPSSFSIGDNAKYEHGYIIKFKDISPEQVKSLVADIKLEGEVKTRRVNCIKGADRLIQEHLGCKPAGFDKPGMAGGKLFDTIIKKGFLDEYGSEVPIQIIRTSERVGDLADNRNRFRFMDRLHIGTVFLVVGAPSAGITYVVLKKKDKKTQSQSSK